MQSRSHGCYNLQLVLRVSLSTASRICREAMGLEDLRSKKQENPISYRSHILGTSSSTMSFFMMGITC